MIADARGLAPRRTVNTGPISTLFSFKVGLRTKPDRASGFLCRLIGFRTAPTIRNRKGFYTFARGRRRLLNARKVMHEIGDMEIGK
jgi:hypothetical protein